MLPQRSQVYFQRFPSSEHNRWAFPPQCGQVVVLILCPPFYNFLYVWLYTLHKYDFFNVVGDLLKKSCFWNLYNVLKETQESASKKLSRKKEKMNMKVKVSVGENIYTMACGNGQLRPGKGKVTK